MLDFPSPATTGQLYVVGGNTWRFDSAKWVQLSGALAMPDAPSDGHTYGRNNAAWTSVDAQIAPVSTTATQSLNNVGRNLVHNPVYTVQQRGTGPWTASGYTLDRWNLGVSTDTVSISVTTMTDAQRTAIGDEAATYCLTNVFTGNAAAGASHFIEQRIENVRRLSNRTVTISFWAAGSASQKLGVSALQFFGTGGSPSGPVTINGVAVQLTGAWTRYSVTISLPSIAGMTLGTTAGTDYTTFRFWYSSGATNNTQAGGIGVQSGTVQLWGTQLEVGSVATALDKGGSPQAQLAECQRFYQTANVQWLAANQASGLVAMTYMLPVTMRAGATFTSNFTTQSNCSGSAIASAGTGTYQLSTTVTAAGVFNTVGTFTASADL